MPALGAIIKAGTSSLVKSKAKKIATDKLMGKKPKETPTAAGGGMDSGEEKGGALAIKPSESLISNPGGALATISQDSSSDSTGNNVEDVVIKIKKTTLDVQKLLSGSVAAQQNLLDQQRQESEARDFKKEEKDLEKKKPKQEGKFKIPIPGKGFLSMLVGFLTNVIAGKIFTKLIDFAPALKPLIDLLAGAVDFITNIAIFAFDALGTFVLFSERLLGTLRGFVGNIFGEDGAKKFDTFMSTLRDLFQGFLVWKLVGEKIFKALTKSITRAFRIARVIVKKAFRFARNIGKNIVKTALKIPGVKNATAKIASIGSKIISGGAKATSGIFQATKGVAAKGVSKVGGFAAKIFGKAAKVVAPALKAATPAVKGFAGRIPILGPLIVGLVSLMSGEPAGQAIFKSVGAALGGALGTFIPIPILGTLIGETIGVFVGDLFYELILGGGIEGAGQKLKDTFNTFVKPIFDFFKDGIGRFFTNFPMISVPSGFGAQTALGKLLPFMADSDGLVTQLPDLSLLLPVVGTGKLIKHMVASFFPNLGEKGEKGAIKSGKTTKDESNVIEGDLTTITFDGKTVPRGLSGPMETFGGKGGSTYKDESTSSIKPTILPSGNTNNQVDSISEYATYEGGEVESGQVVLAPTPANPQTQTASNTGTGRLVKISLDTSDPYEVLYKS